MASSWSTRFPVYQIDFQAVASGKHIASTKRKVRWRFGFPNLQALAAGRTGVDCRGEEHDIVIIWSITSGKRQVYMDGTEIHFSSSRAGVFQYSWSAKGNHVMKVLAHAAPPISATPGFRQYDLFIDGQSFFSMPKAYELGIRASHDRAPGNYGQAAYGGPTSAPGIPAPVNREQEETDLQKAISASLQESRQFLAGKEQSDNRGTLTLPAPAPSATADLMDLGAPPQPAYPDSGTVMSHNTMPPGYGAPPSPYGAPPSPYGAPPSPYGAPPSQYGAPPAPQYGSAPPPASPYQPSPAYSAPPQPAAPYQSPPPPQASNALVVSGTPSNPYGTAPPVQPPAPMYGAPPPAPYAPVPPPAAAPAYGSPPPQTAARSAVPTGDLFAPAPVDPFAPAQPPANDPFGLSQPVVDDPFAPKPPPPPTREDITNSILNAYGAQPSPQQQGQAYQQPSQPGQQPGQHAPITNGQGGQPGLSMNGYTQEPAEKPLSELEKAMKKLVNVDRIDEPAEQEYKLSIAKKEEAKRTKDGKSKGLPPVATGLVGSHATLDHIKEVKPHTPKTGDGVMKAPPQLFHPDAVNAGALVVHGQGPPPIQRGFGLGYGAPPPNYQQQRW